MLVFRLSLTDSEPFFKPKTWKQEKVIKKSLSRKTDIDRYGDRDEDG